MIRAALDTRAIDPAALIASIASTGYGAISLFAGTVRDTSDGRGVSAIDYSAYTSMAEAELRQIVAEAADRFGVTSLVVEHRIGVLSLGETSVAIAAAQVTIQTGTSLSNLINNLYGGNGIQLKPNGHQAHFGTEQDFLEFTAALQKTLQAR